MNPLEMSPTGAMPDGRKRQVGLEHQARMVEQGLWPTPKSSPSGPDYARMERENSGGDDLATAVAKVEGLLPTPRASDGAKGGPGQRDSKGYPALAAIAPMLPTPTAQDAKNSTLPSSQMERDSVPGHLLRNGVRGQLNPAWVEWLMGYPAGWTDCGD